MTGGQTSATPLRLTADWVVPVAAPPMARGAVLLDSTGLVSEVGPDHQVARPVGVPTLDFAGAALIPGLINCHTHLELTGLGQLSETDFAAWIRRVREVKASRSAEDFRQAAEQGVRDAFAAGITTVFDTGDSGAVLPALAALGGSGVAYQEVFGPHPDRCAESMATLRQQLEELRRFETPRARLGVSPHAPYTVSGPLYRAVAELAREESLPIAVHLAESVAETAFVTRHEGSFAAAWEGRGIPPLERHGEAGREPGARRSPVAWLDAHGVLGAQTLAIHAVQLDQEDLDLLAARGVGVAHCPLSNAHHGHGAAPLGALRQRGVRVGVGTDSVVSVGRLDLFAEIRAAARLGGLEASQALALATREAARLVGWDDRLGWLGSGCYGDVTVVDLPSDLAAGRVEEGVIAQGPDRVRATFASGRPVYRRG